TVPSFTDQARADVIRRELAGVRKLMEGRKTAAKSAFDKWQAGLKPEAVGGTPTTVGLTFHAPFAEGIAEKLNLTVNGKKRVVKVTGSNWTEGKTGKALDVGASTQLVLKDVGDLNHPGSFSYGAWVRLSPGAANGALFGRMDEGNSFRGWDLWLEGGKVGAHIINAWPGNAVKVVATKPLKTGQWQHVFITYDGSGKADGLQIYIDGEKQTDRNVQADALKGTTRTKVPFKLAQR